MSERIKQRIREHSHQLSARVLNPEPYEDRLLEFILSEIAEAEIKGEAKALNELRHIVAELKSIERQNMVTADTLKASSDALTAAVTGAIALIGNPTASTPDTVVKQFQSNVDAQTARLNAAEAPPAPAPAPAPTP